MRRKDKEDIEGRKKGSYLFSFHMTLKQRLHSIYYKTIRHIGQWWLFLFFCIFSIVSLASVFAGDILTEAFRWSIQREQVINVGETKEAVWNTIFVWWQEVNVEVWLKDGVCVKDDKVIEVAGDDFEAKKTNCVALWWTHSKINLTANKKSPWIVRAVQILLRFLIIVSITMVIFNGIRYILAAGNADQAWTARKNLLSLGVWIILALSSISLIYLIQSFTNTSSNIETLTFMKEAVEQPVE